MEKNKIKEQILKNKCEVRIIFNDEATGKLLYTLYMACDATEIPIHIIERAAGSIKWSEDQKVIEADKEKKKSLLSRWITKAVTYLN